MFDETPTGYFLKWLKILGIISIKFGPLVKQSLIDGKDLMLADALNAGLIFVVSLVSLMTE